MNISDDELSLFSSLFCDADGNNADGSTDRYDLTFLDVI